MVVSKQRGENDEDLAPAPTAEQRSAIVVAAALVTRVFNSPGAVFDTIAVANFAGSSVLVVVVAFVRRAQARGDADARP